MNWQPKVGDVWVGEDDNGRPIFRIVTAVVPVPHEGFEDKWLVSLDEGPPTHRGWWWGQGWSEMEPWP